MPANITLSDKIKIVLEWSPAIGLATAVANAAPGRERVAAIMTLLAFATQRTKVTLDDDLVRLVEATLLTEQGGALVDYVSNLIAGLAKQVQYEADGHSGT